MTVLAAACAALAVLLAHRPGRPRAPIARRPRPPSDVRRQRGVAAALAVVLAVAGHLHRAGDRVTDFAPGDRVCFVTQHVEQGSNAERIVRPAGEVVAMPGGLEIIAAADRFHFFLELVLWPKEESSRSKLLFLWNRFC